MIIKEQGKLKFPIPIFTQWFAAQSFISSEKILQEITQDTEKMELWQYPLVIAVANFSSEKATEILCRLTQRHPLLASEVIREALLNQGINSELNALTERKIAIQLKSALRSWATGLNSLKKIIFPVSQNDNLLDVEVRIQSRKAYIEEWSLPEEEDSFQELETPNWMTLSFGVSKRARDMSEHEEASESDEVIFEPGRSYGLRLDNRLLWYWQWTREELVKSLSKLLQQRSLPLHESVADRMYGWDAPPPATQRFPPQRFRIPSSGRRDNVVQGNSILLHESVWASAAFLLGRYQPPLLDLTPMPLQRIWHVLSSMESYNSGLGLGVDGVHMMQLELLVRQLLQSGEHYLHYPWLKRFSDEPEDLLAHAQEVYKLALEEYQKIVKSRFLNFYTYFETHSQFPARLVGELALNPEVGDLFGLSWYWKTLPKHSQNEVQITLCDLPQEPKHHNLGKELSKFKVPKFQEAFGFKIFSGDKTLLNVTPITDIVYGWLWEDLKNLGWLEGTLGDYMFSEVMRPSSKKEFDYQDGKVVMVRETTTSYSVS